MTQYFQSDFLKSKFAAGNRQDIITVVQPFVKEQILSYEKSSGPCNINT